MQRSVQRITHKRARPGWTNFYARTFGDAALRSQGECCVILTRIRVFGTGARNLIILGTGVQVDASSTLAHVDESLFWLFFLNHTFGDLLGISVGVYWDCRLISQGLRGCSLTCTSTPCITHLSHSTPDVSPLGVSFFKTSGVDTVRRLACA